MRRSSRLFRLSTSVAIGALLGNGALPTALAQPAPPAAQITPPDQGQGDPPDRVGRIASETGAVSFRTSSDTEWSPAVTNYPVSPGNVFWTEPSARAELEISASRIDLSGQTEFEVTSLDAGGLQAMVPQGEIYLHLTDLAPNESWSIQTPRGMVRLTRDGRYGIVSGTIGQPTLITVVEGAATISGPGLSQTIAANQTATVEGNGPFHATIGPEIRDAFLASRLGVERPPPQVPPPVAARLPALPEIGDLSGIGEWDDVPDYGELWYPPVAPGWMPYQNGQWAYVEPWGWTWVDSASWGFVPFHYGRWAHIGHRWGWIPGEARAAERPVYAPALVAFLGFSAGAAVGAAIAHGSVGWVPLGPGEAYHPWYRASGRYVQQINAGHVRDPAAINNPVVGNLFVNRSAATAVPAGVLLGSRPVRPAAQPLSATSFAAAHPLIGVQPIAPTAATLGVTPAVAHQLNLGGEATARRFAPGPVVRAQQPGSPPALGGRPGGPPRPGDAVFPGGNAAPFPGGNMAPRGPLPLVVPAARPPGLPEPRGAGAPAGPEVVRLPGAPPLQQPANRPTGMFEPRGTNPPGALVPGAPGGLRPDGRPATGPETDRPPGVPQPHGARPTGMFEPPGGRTPGMFEPHDNRPPQSPLAMPPAAPRPQFPGQEPAGRLPFVEHPFHELPQAARAPEVHQPPPRIEAPVPPHVLQPLPRVETPPIVPAPPPHVLQPPPHAEAPRIAPPVQHVEPPRPVQLHPEPLPQRRPGERPGQR